MIQLQARVTVAKLKAIVQTVPKALGGKMQVKRVKPTYEEQTIKPDEDYDGLSAVIVEPKPRPLFVSSLTDEITNHIVVNADFAPGGSLEETPE